MPVQRKLDEDCVPVQRKLNEECECKSEPDSTSASVCASILNSTSASSPVGGSYSSSYLELSSHKVRRIFHGTVPNCQSPVRIDELGGCRRREAEFNGVIWLPVTQGCFVSPCGILGTLIALECATVKVAAPWKTGFSNSVLRGRQINDIANFSVSSPAFGSPRVAIR